MNIHTQINKIKLKNNFQFIIIVIALIFFPKNNFGQIPNLGTASSFALFTVTGAFGNTGTTNITGDIGTNVGAITGSPIVSGQIHEEDSVTAQAAADVDSAYIQLNRMSCGAVLGNILGNNDTLIPNVYCLGGASTLNGNLILDGQGNPNATFVFQIDGAFSVNALSNIILINSATLCHVYWQINGAFSLGDSAVFQGTIVANGAISLLDSSNLFGRGLSIAGAISLNNNIVAVGSQPIASIISAGGATTFDEGDSVLLSGNDGGIWCTTAITATVNIKTSGNYCVTNSCACGSVTSNYILVTVNSVILPITLVSLIAEKCSANSCVNLNWQTASESNSAYFRIEKSTNGINFNSIGERNAAGNSSQLLSYFFTDEEPVQGINYYRLNQIDLNGNQKYSQVKSVSFSDTNLSVSIYPNPFKGEFTVCSLQSNAQLQIYNSTGKMVFETTVYREQETINLGGASGMYFYKVIGDNKTIQSGKLISQQ